MDVVIFVISALMWFAIGWYACAGYYQRKAIQKGFARYNEKTGDWEWKIIDEVNRYNWTKQEIEKRDNELERISKEWIADDLRQKE